MYPCIKRNARPNNNQLITYYLCVRYLLRIQQYPVNNTDNTGQQRRERENLEAICANMESK